MQARRTGVNKNENKSLRHLCDLNYFNFIKFSVVKFNHKSMPITQYDRMIIFDQEKAFLNVAASEIIFDEIRVKNIYILYNIYYTSKEDYPVNG